MFHEIGACSRSMRRLGLYCYDVSVIMIIKEFNSRFITIMWTNSFELLKQLLFIRLFVQWQLFPCFCLL